MADHSRRNFLRSASAGAVAVGAAAVLPAGAASASTSAPGEAASAPTHAGPFVAWVEDANSGNVVMLVDDREVVHHDPALARHLAAIAASARTA